MNFYATGAGRLKLKLQERVCFNAAALIETFLDADRWAEMFPCMIVEAETLDVFSNEIDATKNGPIQLIEVGTDWEFDYTFVMHVEIQLPSPLIPDREYNFIRICKQYAEGKWVMDDVSFEYGCNGANGNPNMSCENH
ncbi:hypothetical protein P8452_51067 [Trifolium repens]|nr:hypothetical protein P8452_51067 [Trifolium repens]